MDKKQKKPQPQVKTELMKLEEELHMTRKQAMDMVYAICARSKQRIAQGHFYTIEESMARAQRILSENETDNK